MRGLGKLLLLVGLGCASTASAQDLRLSQAPTPYVGTKKVDVDGSTLRVTIKKTGAVVVASKAFLVLRTPELHDRMHEAVRLLTSCELTDEMWAETTLIGRLRCGAGGTSPKQDH